MAWVAINDGVMAPCFPAAIKAGDTAPLKSCNKGKNKGEEDKEVH
jgi:hypothetical protein